MMVCLRAIQPNVETFRRYARVLTTYAASRRPAARQFLHGTRAAAPRDMFHQHAHEPGSDAPSRRRSWLLPRDAPARTTASSPLLHISALLLDTRRPHYSLGASSATGQRASAREMMARPLNGLHRCFSMIGIATSTRARFSAF